MAHDDTPIHPDKLTSGRKPLPDDEGLPFERLGHFEILSKIGSGGMGDVYKGYDEHLQRTVAVKVLPLELARDKGFVKRFHAEAKAVATLDHANIASIHFTGEESGYHFFAMQYVAGESLAERLDRCEQLAVDTALDIAEQMLGGLEAAHTAGLIHRDIKPGNILIEEDTGHVVLVDFGLVRTLGDGSTVTAAGTVVGTVDYLAPEQARGEPVDIRADLYSVGVLLYRMLAGRLPFSAGVPAAVIYQHAHEPAPRLREVVPNLPAEVEAIVATLIEKDPACRYQTASEVIEAIRACRSVRTAPTHRTRTAATGNSLSAEFGSRQSWATAAIGGVSAAALLVILAGYLFSLSGSPVLSSGGDTPATVGPDHSGAAATPADVKLEPGDELPRNQWVDVLQYVDPSWDVVSGGWWREEGGVTTEPSKMSRIMLPIEIGGSYDIKAEFTRTSGKDSINLIIPVGQRTCRLTLAGWAQTAHGLGKIDGRTGSDRANPARFTPGKLVNDRRYRVLASIRTKKDDVTIDVSLDGKPIIAWKGKQSSLSVTPYTGLPYSKRAALMAYDSTVTYHSASLRSISGKTKLAQRPEPPFDDGPNDRWVDLLANVDLKRDTIHGHWFRLEEAISVAPVSADEGLVRLMLPEVVDGSYDLVAEFTRNQGSDSVTIALPVGIRTCILHFSACNGKNAGLEQIDGKRIVDAHNPAVRRPGSLVNGRRYKALVSVRLLPSPGVDDDDAVIDVWLDGRPYVRWSGRASLLDLGAWKFPEPRHVGLGANRALVTFHSVRLQNVSGE